MDIYQVCINEVALEGLDGITISALWLRLDNREEKITVKLSPTLKEILWKFLLQHSSVKFYQLDSDRNDPVIFNRYLGIDITTGKHVAVAPDELDMLQNIYYVKPVTNKPDVRGSCFEYDTRIDMTDQLKEEHMSLDATIDRFGEQKLVIVASQAMRESVLRGPGVSSQTIENLTDIEYCILECIGRSRWQGELQTVLNNIVFKQLKSAHIHYMMKSLLQKNLITKQPYSYVRDDKNGKVYQQILLHLPHFRIDARSVADIRAETVCEMLKQYEEQSISCSDLRQIMAIEGKAFRKLVSKMIAAGYIKVESVKTAKISEKRMTLIKTPSEKQDDDIFDDTMDESVENDGEGTGLVAELPLTLQGYRHIFSTGENGCSQGDLNRKLKGYGSLESRHLCRKVEKAKIAKIVMVDHGKQRTQKYIADAFALNSKHTKQFFAEQKKMQKILKTSDRTSQVESSDIAEKAGSSTISEDDTLNDSGLSLVAEAGDLTAENDLSQVSSFEANSAETQDESTITLNDGELSSLDLDQDPSMKRSKWDTHQTARKMKRTNSILTYVNDQKIVEGFFVLQKLLQDEEKEEGLTTKVCKKTVKRLVQKLHNDGRLKHFAVPISSNDCTIEVDFVMSLDCDSLRLKTAIEQAQFRKYSDDSKKMASEPVALFDLTSPSFVSHNGDGGIGLPELDSVEKVKLNNKFLYGYQPKFLRNQVVHEYLWYLAYGHPMNGKENMAIFDYDKVREYSTEKNWRRFLPPVPHHPSFGPGWIQVGDAAVLLPLTLICQFHQFSYKIEGLEHYLTDPIQKNALVRHLPSKMRSLLFHKRKYLFSLIQVIENLAFMGLVTFNKQRKSMSMRSKKEYEMIYIHQNLNMWDTRKSERGYSEITEGIVYEKLEFKLDSYETVSTYWSKLRDISLMTPLGVRSGTEEEFEPGTRHATKMKAFIADHVNREVQAPADDGSIPGDNKGAAGLDSSLFVHLYRNWFRPVKTVKLNSGLQGYPDTKENILEDGKEKPKRLPKLVPTQLTLTEENAKRTKKRSRPTDSTSKKRGATSSEHDLSKKLRSSNASRNDVIVIEDEKATASDILTSQPGLSKKTKSSNADLNDVIIIEDQKAQETNPSTGRDSFSYEVITESNVGRRQRVKGGRGKKRAAIADHSVPAVPQKKTRKSRDKKPTEKKKKVKYTDALDKQALSKLNGRLRVSFCRGEDDVLLMCRISSTLIQKALKVKKRAETQHVVSGMVIRNLLWNISPSSNDKTSYACLRRIRVLMKNRNASLCHDISVAEIQEDGSCAKKLFDSFKDKQPLDDQDEIEALYMKVFDEVQKRFQVMRPTMDIALPDTVDEVDQKYVLKVFAFDSSPTTTRVVSMVASQRDINLAVLENLIYISLTLNEDEFSQYQAYKIFQNYSQELIAEVWEHVRISGLVCRKPDNYHRRLRHLPFAVPAYHVSSSHFQSVQAGPLWKVLTSFSAAYKSFKNTNALVCDMNASCAMVILANMSMLDNFLNYELVCPTQAPEAMRAVTEQEKSMKRIPESNDATLSSQNDDDDDETKKDDDDVSEKELFHLIKRQRFDDRIRSVSSQLKVLEPVMIRSKDATFGICNEEEVIADVCSTIRSLDSIKLSPEEAIICVDENQEWMKPINHIISDDFALKECVESVVTLVGEAGVIGIPLPALKKQLHRNSNVNHNQIKTTLSQLLDHRAVFIVGVWHKRVVLKQFASNWFLEGSLFKGDREFLRQEIRKDLSGAHCRYKKSTNFGSYSDYHNRGPTAHATFENSVLIDQDLESASSKPVVESNSKSDVEDLSSTSKLASEILSDASNYEPIRYLCRPWHNVSGEVNYNSAKLLMSGMFAVILWNPGITLAALSDRFINVMQRIAIIELVEKLTLCKCIVRRKGQCHKTWQLFRPLEDDIITNVTSEDHDYFVVTPDGLLRMTYLCRELDQLQVNRNISLDLSKETLAK